MKESSETSRPSFDQQADDRAVEAAADSFKQSKNVLSRPMVFVKSGVYDTSRVNNEQKGNTSNRATGSSAVLYMPKNDRLDRFKAMQL